MLWTELLPLTLAVPVLRTEELPLTSAAPLLLTEELPLILAAWWIEELLQLPASAARQGSIEALERRSGSTLARHGIRS
jgi:hypothetical protein